MNTNRISMIAIVALVLATAAVSPSLASAQDVSGKFTLPCTTYWDNAVLPAGSYSFSIATIANGGGEGAILNVRGQKSLKAIVMVRHGASFKQSALVLGRAGGSAVVTKMYLADAGVLMNFRAAPAARELLASASTQPATVETILVKVD